MSRLSSSAVLATRNAHSPLAANVAARPANLDLLNQHLGLSTSRKISSAVQDYAELITGRALAHLASPSKYPLAQGSVEQLLVEHIQTLSSDRKKAIQNLGKSFLADAEALRVATAGGLTSVSSAEELVVSRYTSGGGLRGVGRVGSVREVGGLARAAERLKVRAVEVAAASTGLPRGTFGEAADRGVRREASDVSFDTVQLVLNSIKCTKSQQKTDTIFIHAVLLTSEGEVKGDQESLGEFKTGDKTKTYDNRVVISKALNPDPDVTQTFGALVTLIEQDTKRLGALLERVMEKILIIVRRIIEDRLKKKEDEVAMGDSVPTSEGEVGDIVIETITDVLIEVIMEAVAELLAWFVEFLGDDVFGDSEIDTISVNAEEGFGDDQSVKNLPILRFRDRGADYKLSLSWRLT